MCMFQIVFIDLGRSPNITLCICVLHDHPLMGWKDNEIYILGNILRR
jgi:hypothetical protein